MNPCTRSRSNRLRTCALLLRYRRLIFARELRPPEKSLIRSQSSDELEDGKGCGQPLF